MLVKNVYFIKKSNMHKFCINYNDLSFSVNYEFGDGNYQDYSCCIIILFYLDWIIAFLKCCSPVIIILIFKIFFTSFYFIYILPFFRKPQRCLQCHLLFFFYQPIVKANKKRVPILPESFQIEQMYSM